MERLTKNILDPMMLCPVLKTLDDKNAYCQSQHCDCDNCRLGKQLVKLAYYENLEEQGVLLKLPCKVGDKVYDVVLCDDGIHRIKEMHVGSISPYGSVYNGKLWHVFLVDDYTYAYRTFFDFGKTIFLTKEKAEKALAEMEE